MTFLVYGSNKFSFYHKFNVIGIGYHQIVRSSSYLITFTKLFLTISKQLIILFLSSNNDSFIVVLDFHTGICIL